MTIYVIPKPNKTQVFNALEYNPVGSYFQISPEAQIHDNVIIDYSGGIVMEAKVSVSSGVVIYTHRHPVETANWHGQQCKFYQLHIEEGALIGVNAIILPKVCYIGKWSVIGAGSVVTKRVPDYEIWAGNPAKKIKGVIHNET